MGPRKLTFLLDFGTFLCCILSGLTEAGLRMNQSQSPISALLGEDVTVPCILQDNEKPELDLDLSTSSMAWQKKTLDGSVYRVYMLTNHNSTSFRAGSNVELSEFKRGNASLSMKNVQISDEGEYSCTVIVTPDKVMATVTLQVSVKPTVSLTSNELTIELGQGGSVSCEFIRFYPASVSLKWLKSARGLDNWTALKKEICLIENDDGTFNGSSHMLLENPSTSEDGDIYSCILSHRSFTSDQVLNFTLSVKEKTGDHVVVLAALIAVELFICLYLYIFTYIVKVPPKLSEITGADNLVQMKRSTLTCMISGFKPMEIRVRVYAKRKEGSERKLIGIQEYPKKISDYERVVLQDLTDHLLDGMETLKPKRSLLSSDCLCVLHVTPDIEKDDGAELTIEVEHPALKSPISKHCTLIISGDFLMLSNIESPTYQIHGKEVTLKCCMTTFNRESLHISWLKKDLKKQELTKMIYDEGRADSRYSHEIEEKKHRHYQIWSSLKFKINVKEDHEKEMICMVKFPKANIMKETELRIFVRAEPVIEAITPSQAVPHVGQEMALTCRIHSFHPQDIDITWHTEDLSLPPPNNESHVGEDGLYNVTSVLRYIPQIEDIGRTFRCTVDHHSFDNPKTLEWTLEDLRQNDV